MRDGQLNRRGFLGALGALTALVVATPLAARAVRRPPAALTEKTPPPVRGMASDMATVEYIYKKLYSTEWMHTRKHVFLPATFTKVEFEAARRG